MHLCHQITEFKHGTSPDSTYLTLAMVS